MVCYLLQGVSQSTDYSFKLLRVGKKVKQTVGWLELDKSQP